MKTIFTFLATLLLPLAALSAADAPANGAVTAKLWSKERAWEWYKKQPWIVGFNFVPSTACNTTEMWSAETFDAPTIDKELGMGAKLGFNSCRVFIQYIVWKNDAEGLKKRLGQFLSMAESHGISTTLVLFDDCTFGAPPQFEPFMGKQREPIPGMILSSWTPSPGHKHVKDVTVWPDLEKYVKDIVGTFAKDKRVLMWDLYNEPTCRNSRNLIVAAFAWARQADPEQPLTTCWQALDLSDVVSFHSYTNYKGMLKTITDFRKHERPVICTEWMARPAGSKWETDLPLFKQQGTGCYNWGLVNGRTQCQFNWHDKPGTTEPKVWFHDLFHKDGTPYDPAEHEAIRKTTADKTIDWTTPAPLPQPFTEESITFSASWEKYAGIGPASDRLWYTSTKGETATKEISGSSVEVVFKHGPDCGIAGVTVDGKPVADVDTYAKELDWNKKTVVARDLSPGKHTVVVTATGRKAKDSKNSLVQLIDINGSEAVESMKTPPMYFGDSTRLGRPFAKDPSVIRFGGRYLLYYSVSAWAKELAPPDAPRGWAIGIAESHDLVNWKKIGEILPEQECEKNGIVNGRIILLDGKLHLFYNTYGNGARDALCHATSEDGIHFTRNPTNPIWHPTGDWNNGRAIDVDVVEWGDKLIMYYATRDPAGKIQMLHAIAAPRKSGFNRDDWKSLCDGPVLKPELPWEKSCIEAPSVIKRGDSLYLFYGGGYNNAPQQIGCAVSKDGIHFQRLFIDKPLLPNGAPGTWNSSESGHPGMFEDADGQLYLFYQANNDHGRTWFISGVKIGWDGDKPRVIEPH